MNPKPLAGQNCHHLFGFMAWLPIPLIAIGIAILLVLNINTLFEPSFLIPSINIIIFIAGSMLAAILAARGYIDGGAKTLLLLGCGLLTFGAASVAGSVLVSTGHINEGVTAHNIGALMAGAFHLIGALSISMYLLGSAIVFSRRIQVLGLYFLCLLFLAVVSYMAHNNLFPVFITTSGPTQARSVILWLTVAEYMLSAIIFALYDCQRTGFLKWYWMGLALIGLGLAAVALEKVPGTPLSWLGRISQSLGQLYILGCLIAVLYRVRTANGPHSWGIGQSFRQIEDALRESEERFRAAFENGSIPMALTSFENKLIKVNRAYCQLLGFSESELVGHSFTELTYPDDIDENLIALAKISKGELDVFRMDKRYICKDGNIVWVDMSTAVVRDEQNQALYLVTHFQDITERKRAEIALRDSEERFRAAFENGAVPMAITALDNNNKLIKVNKAFCQLLGFSESELVGHSFSEFTHPDDLTKNLQGIRAVTSGEQDVFRMEKRYICKNGSIIWVDMSTAGVRDVQGQPLYMVTHVQDITERKRAEQALLESEQRFRYLVEVTSDWVWAVDHNGVYTYSSPKIKDLLGYEPEEMIGKTPFDFMPLDEAVRMREKFIELLNSQKPIINVENINLHKNGRRLMLETSGVPIFDSENKVVGYRGIDRDITERKQAEEALRESEERFRMLFASMNEGFYLSEILYDENGNPCDYRYLDVNPSFEQIMNLSRDQIIGKTFKELVPPDPSCGWLETFINVSQTGNPINYCFYSNVYHCYFETFAFTPAPGQFAAVVADITERKQAEEELRKAKEGVEEQVHTRTKQLQKAIDALQSEVSERLVAEQALRASHKELRSLASELSLAEERERRRIALLLHDHIGQLLAVSKMKLGAAQKISQDGSAKSIEEIRWLIEEAIKSTRSLTLEISPPSLYTLGLEVALSEMCEKFAADYSIPCSFEHNGKSAVFTEDLRAILFRSTGELLLNVLKHANATTVKVCLCRQEHQVELKVQDNGIGFDTSELASRTAGQSGFGIMSIRERINHLGGSVSIESSKDKGTTVALIAPFQGGTAASL